MKKGQHIDFRDQIARNKRNSVILLIIVFFVLIGIGYVIGLAIEADFFLFMTIFSLFSILYIWLTYYFSANIALASVGAHEASKEKYRNLYHLVEGLTIASGLPMPKVFIMNQEAINAFATGRNPQNSVVCVTSGALSKLNKEELEAVLAHELSHIRNYDIRFVTITAVVVGLIEIIAQMFLRSMFYSSGNRDRGNANAIFMILGILLAILAPIVVKLVQLAISRKREFMADAGSVEMTRYPKGLISALEKIKNDSNPLKVNRAVAPMFLSNDDKKSKFSSIFQTHPPIDMRIKILKAM